MKIIPAIDLIDGKCVRLTEGKYETQKTYDYSPLEMAKQYEDHGIQYLHLVDLDGAKLGAIQNIKTLEQIANQTNLQIDFGGGVKSRNEVIKALNAGAAQVNIGSLAIKEPLLFAELLSEFGPDKIILAADSKNGKVASTGWTDESAVSLFDILQEFQKNGGRKVVCTDISKDGKLEGPSTTLYKSIKAKFNFELIASGGVSCLADLDELEEAACDGVIIGKAIYENRISLKELQKRC